MDLDREVWKLIFLNWRFAGKPAFQRVSTWEKGVTEALISRICQLPHRKYPTHKPPNSRYQCDVTDCAVRKTCKFSPAQTHSNQLWHRPDLHRPIPAPGLPRGQLRPLLPPHHVSISPTHPCFDLLPSEQMLLLRTCSDKLCAWVISES